MHVRVLPELRSQQVKEGHQMTACHVLYFGENFDLGDTEIPATYERVGVARGMMALFHSRSRVLEIPEPLWVRFLPVSILLVMAWKLGGLAQRIPRFVVCYAIENNNVDDLIFGPRRVPKVVRSFARRVLANYVSRTYDRVAFGTEGARVSYQPLIGNSRLATIVTVELPTASAFSVGSTVPDGAVFVGQLEPRKGLKELMLSWPQVETMRPAARLTIVGDGAMRAEVSRWCSESPITRQFMGRLEHDDIPAVLAVNAVLVAPSIRWKRWREQVGLPISEALSMGLTVVTSDETGLAPWLVAQGHTVIAAHQLSTLLASAILKALSAPLARTQVLASLPTTAPRRESDLWMHAVDDHAHK